MLSTKQGGIKYHFWVFSMARPGTEPRSTGPLANTLLIRLMARFLDGFYSKLFITNFNSMNENMLSKK